MAVTPRNVTDVARSGRRTEKCLAKIMVAALLLATGCPGARAGEAPVASPSQDCVEADVGNDHAASLGCLNQRFAHSAEQVHQGQPVTPPLDARSPSTAVGTANVAAAQQMMGNAFGKSAIPQRPQLYYPNPLLQTPR